MDNEKEHDFTKLMLEAIRAKSSNHIRSINENESGDMGAGFESPTSQTPISGDQAKPNIDVEEIEVDSDVEKQKEDQEIEDNGLNTPEAKEEIDNMGKQVSQLVTITTFRIHEDNGNVIMSGNFQNTDLEWSFSKNDGLFIDASNVNLTEELKSILDKLSNYYINWRDGWASKIGEYTKND